MNKVINCTKEDNPLIHKKLREVSVEEGLSIATELFQILNKRGTFGTHQPEDYIEGN